VVIELDHTSLALTQECISEAQSIANSEQAEKFIRNYGTLRAYFSCLNGRGGSFVLPGNVFAATLTLGGELHSTRSLTEKEKTSLEATKDHVKTAAGFSLSSPYLSAGISGGTAEAGNVQTLEQQLRQNLRLAWHARGGDTILCSKYVSLSPLLLSLFTLSFLC
jgi:hypothetical protein